MSTSLRILAGVACMAWLAMAAGVRGDQGTPEAKPAGQESTDRLSWRFAYDDGGRPTEIVDPAGRKTAISYTFDQQERLQSMTRRLPDGSQIVQHFDRFGRRTEMSDGAGVVRYGYDGFGRVVSVCRDGTPAIAYTYDTLDRVTSLTVGDRWKVEYRYDFLGRLAKMITPAGQIAYDFQTGSGEVRRTLPNGIVTIWKYRPDGGLESLLHGRPLAGAQQIEVFCRFEYSYRADGLISRVKELNGGERTLDYEYDVMQRLTVVKDSRGGKTEYRYDQLGNRTELRWEGQPPVTTRYDWAGRLKEHNGQPCSYDTVGNLVSFADAGETQLFTFEGRNLLVSTSQVNETTNYQYDGNSCLIARTAAGKTAKFVCDPFTDLWCPLLESDSEGNQKFYVWEGDVLVAVLQSERVQFLLHDHSGSARCIADKDGQIVERRDYGPFGELLSGTPPASLEPGFCGIFFDPVPKLYLTRARAYDPRLGRFLQREPRLDTLPATLKDLSAYAYCGADPVNSVDTTGYFWIPPPYMPYRRQWPDAIPLPTPTGATEHQDKPQVKTTIWEKTFGPLLNVVGIGSNWIGPNRSGGEWKSKVDESGRLPLGGTLVPPRNWIDAIARRHDIQDWVNWHVPQGKALTIPGPDNTYEQYTSRGRENFEHNTEAFWAFVKGLPAQFARNVVLVRLVDNLVHTQTAKSSEGTVPYRRDIRDDAVQSARNRDNTRWYPRPPGDDDGGGGGGAAAIGAASPLNPSNVGGVSLQGAGDALKDLGPLRGIALDENGRLVLLSEGENQIGLPPLRMDDVVTVFRSVYEFGEAPSVSIDPDPKAPSGPTMLVRHGHATTDTYVGWVLFEADRVMKGYSLGRDNLTQKPLSTKIGGYQELFRHMGAGVGAGQKEIWERFWIVPAAVERRQSKNQRLTLFDVPLKLRTERMELREGKLVTAADPTPTKFAQAFSQWFTDHYAEIEAETIADPPPGRGIGSPVSCFAELRRIALITAIAETLRDQGVPIPAWIRDYPVKTCRVEPTTPAIDVGGPAQGWRIHGGVNLGVADKDLRTIPASPEAESLAPAVHHAVAEVSLLSTAAFTVEGKTYEAVVLPGAGTKALGACQLVASDLAVPVARGATISVTRRFHSFFRPAGEFGAGWTLDLPYLKEQSAPVSREDGRVLLRPTYQLGSPLDSLVATFRTRRLVQEVNAELLVPDQDSEILGLTGMEERRIGTPTQAVLFRGGECWHFDDAGRLVGVERAPLLIAYRRGDGGRLERIEGWYGKARKADIRLTYDDQGRLSAARGSDGQEVSYAYGASGGLTKATGPAGKLRYEYDANGQVRSVERNGRLLQAFAYSSRGELVRQRRTDGIEIGYQISPVAGGAAVAGTIGGQSIETATFDRALRPLERTLPDGTQIGWTNHESGAVDTVATTPGGDSVAVSRSADGKTEEWRLTEGGTYRLSYDPKGQVVTVSEGERPVSRQEYEADGQLRQIAFESSLLQAVYDDDRVLVGLHWTSPKEENQPANWLEIRLDESGRAAQMRDATGLELQVQYDTQTGEPSRVTSQRAHVEMQRNAQGQVVGIETSWGYRLTNILDADGHVKTAEIRVGDDRAMIHYQAGRPSIVKQMDGGQFRLQYHAGGENEGLVQQVETPNGLTLKYDYAQGHLTDVSVNQAYRCKLSYDGAGRLSECVHMPFAR